MFWCCFFALVWCLSSIENEGDISTKKEERKKRRKRKEETTEKGKQASVGTQRTRLQLGEAVIGTSNHNGTGTQNQTLGELDTISRSGQNFLLIVSVRGIEELGVDPSGPLEDSALVGEGVEGVFAVVLAHARGANTSKGHVGAGNVQEGAVHGDTARRGILEDVLSGLVVA